MKRNRTLVTSILEQVAKKMGVEIHIEPQWGYVGQIVLPDGRTRYFRNTNLDLNGLGASEIARDKAFADYFMRRMGYPLITGRAFYTARWCKAIGSRNGPDAAYRYAKRLGMPVIVKPNSRSQGLGVHKVRTKREFSQAIKTIEKMDRVFLVQRVAQGKDYRIVVLDGEVISAYERLPLSVVGNGRFSIRRLLTEKQQQFDRTGRDTSLRVDDPRITIELQKIGLTRRSVPAEGEVVTLLPNANLSSGGDAVDVTEKMHPDWKDFVKRLARDMNLRYIGIDIMTKHGLDVTPKDFVVIEVNAAAGLDNYATMGRRQKRIVEDLYRKVLVALLK